MLDDSSRLTKQDKDILQRFHNHAVTHVQAMFDSQPHRERLLYTIRGSSYLPEQHAVFSGSVSIIENLFCNILDDMQVLISILEF